jgi:hypothetical protein
MYPDMKINSWALGDFGRHFPHDDLWDHSQDWEFTLNARDIVAYHYKTRMRWTFQGDGVIIVEQGDKREMFDDHAWMNTPANAFMLWLKKKFPGVNLYA